MFIFATRESAELDATVFETCRKMARVSVPLVKDHSIFRAALLKWTPMLLETTTSFTAKKLEGIAHKMRTMRTQTTHKRSLNTGPPPSCCHWTKGVCCGLTIFHECPLTSPLALCQLEGYRSRGAICVATARSSFVQRSHYPAVRLVSPLIGDRREFAPIPAFSPLPVL